ncbi:MAG: class I SAM-dependent methyltransferase [Steroidobacteraceae bacterium]
MTHDPWPLLGCPECGGRLVPGEAVGCTGCGSTWPTLDGIPWLVSPAADTLGAWRSQLRAHVSALATQSTLYRAALDAAATDGARRRLGLLAEACADHARRLAELLAPLGVTESAAAPEAYRAVAAALPPGQSLTSYYANLHRDWCWGDAENAAALDSIDRALGPGPVGRMLVPGCGAGRLAYDLHGLRRPALTVAADLNPLMLAAAARIWRGEHVRLHEFPIAPRDAESQALLRTLEAPAPAAPGLWPVFADVTAPPFAAASFDTVVTHWLVDVIDDDFATFAARVNHWLAPGGRWVNSGSFFFQNHAPAACHAADELPGLLAAAGFDEVEVREEQVPYLASPASRHARLERVVTFSARVRTRVPVPAPRRHAPAWLERADAALPMTPQVEAHVLALRVQGYIASLVDGRRTIADVASLLVRDRLLPADEALAAVRGFMQRFYADASASPRP